MEMVRIGQIWEFTHPHGAKCKERVLGLNPVKTIVLETEDEVWSEGVGHIGKYIHAEFLNPIFNPILILDFKDYLDAVRNT